MSIKSSIIHLFGGITAEEQERKELARRQNERERQSEIEYRRKTDAILAKIIEQTSKIDVVYSATQSQKDMLDRLKKENEELRSRRDADFSALLRERIKDVPIEKQDRSAVSLQLDIDLITKFDELHTAGYIKCTRSALINRLLRQYIGSIYQSLAMIKKEE